MEFTEFNEFANEEENLIEKEEEDRNRIVGTNIISMKFTDLYFDLGAPEIDELEIVGITESDFEHPTLGSIEKLKRYQEIKPNRHRR